MNQKNEKKLRLGKISIQDLNHKLDSHEQEKVKGGGTSDCAPGITNLPVFC